MDIVVEWFTGDRWEPQCEFSTISVAVAYASEEAQRTAWGSHRVMIDGFLYATFLPLGDS